MEHQCPPPLSVPPAPKPLKILVAEDNPSNQKIMLAMLNRLGHNCKAVANGGEVLHALQIRDYDLILMDLKMLEMDGLVACRIIRGLFSGKRPRIVDIYCQRFRE